MPARGVRRRAVGPPPSSSFPANTAWLALAAISGNLLRRAVGGTLAPRAETWTPPGSSPVPAWPALAPRIRLPLALSLASKPTAPATAPLRSPIVPASPGQQVKRSSAVAFIKLQIISGWPC